jgi:hypothetical protein
MAKVLRSHDRRHEFPPLELSSCSWSGSSEGSHPQLAHRHARRFPLRLGLVLLMVGHLECREQSILIFLLGRVGDALVSPCYAFGWLSFFLGVSYLCFVICVNFTSS